MVFALSSLLILPLWLLFYLSLQKISTSLGLQFKMVCIVSVRLSITYNAIYIRKILYYNDSNKIINCNDSCLIIKNRFKQLTHFEKYIQMELDENSHDNVINKYEKRLEQLPKQNKDLEHEIRKYQQLVEDQEKQIGLQNIKLKAFETDLIKLDKAIETRENQIQALSQSQEKNAAKEKKYFMQIQNYNKKIQASKSQASKIQKSILLLKKEIKTLQSTIAAQNSEKNKVLQSLTKQQIKTNGLTQNLNDLKMKLMQQHNAKDVNEDDTKRDQRQINQLFAAIKKQMALIDVLKRQKVHIVASTVFKYCQEQFQQVLQMNKTK